MREGAGGSKGTFLTYILYLFSLWNSFLSVFTYLYLYIFSLFAHICALICSTYYAIIKLSAQIITIGPFILIPKCYPCFQPIISHIITFVRSNYTMYSIILHTRRIDAKKRAQDPRVDEDTCFPN